MSQMTHRSNNKWQYRTVPSIDENRNDYILTTEGNRIACTDLNNLFTEEENILEESSKSSQPGSRSAASWAPPERNKDIFKKFAWICSRANMLFIVDYFATRENS